MNYYTEYNRRRGHKPMSYRKTRRNNEGMLEVWCYMGEHFVIEADFWPARKCHGLKLSKHCKACLREYNKSRYVPKKRTPIDNSNHIWRKRKL